MVEEVRKKMNIAIITESVPLEDIKTNYKSKFCLYFKMKILSNHEAKEICEIIKNIIKEKSIIFSNKRTIFFDKAYFVEAL